jgi:hypothetical protein
LYKTDRIPLKLWLVGVREKCHTHVAKPSKQLEYPVPPVFAPNYYKEDIAEHIPLTSVMNFSQTDLTESKHSGGRLGIVANNHRRPESLLRHHRHL